jgi:hypothetical protein
VHQASGVSDARLTAQGLGFYTPTNEQFNSGARDLPGFLHVDKAHLSRPMSFYASNAMCSSANPSRVMETVTHPRGMIVIWNKAPKNQGQHSWMNYSTQHPKLFLYKVYEFLSLFSFFLFFVVSKFLNRNRNISTSQLNRLLGFHLKPINLIISQGSITIPYLEAGFPLRCFQRLSKPDIATEQCPWQDSSYTRGQFTPVLSY